MRHLPVSVHETAAPAETFDALLERLDEFDWVAFTSARAVEAVCERPAWLGRQWRPDSRPRLAAVGPATRERLAERGMAVSACPAEAGAPSLAAAIVEEAGGTLAGRAVLWPRSDIARPDLRVALVASGARVVDPIVYRTRPSVPPDLATFVRDLEAGRIDAVTFLSPSSAAHLATVLIDGTLSSLRGRAVVASIGPGTSAALARLGAGLPLEALEHTGSGLASRLLDYFGHQEE